MVQKIDSIFGDTNTNLNELVSTSSDTSYSQGVIQNDNENESFEDKADDDSNKVAFTMIVTFTMISKIIMHLIMQIEKIR